MGERAAGVGGHNALNTSSERRGCNAAAVTLPIASKHSLPHRSFVLQLAEATVPQASHIFQIYGGVSVALTSRYFQSLPLHTSLTLAVSGVTCGHISRT